MKRIVVKLSGMPFDPTYEIDDDTIAVAIGDLVRVPGSDTSFIHDGETGPSSRWAVHTQVPASVLSEPHGRANLKPLPGASPADGQG
jgi:hypothetical protein